MIVELQHVGLTYQAPDGEVTALEDVTFSIQEGEFVSLVGPSGCGKSTLLSAVAGLEPVSAGAILLEGETVTAPSPKIGYMPQQDQLFPWRSIWGNVTLGLEIRGDRDGEGRQRARELLEQYDLADFAKSPPGRLSGGMRQRCALIRTLVTDPGVLLLDEPFSALDCQTRLTVASDIGSIIRQQSKTALLVTHDISEAISLSDRIVVLTARPATVRNIHTLDAELRALSPAARRVHPAFAPLFTEIGKELGLDG